MLPDPESGRPDKCVLMGLTDTHGQLVDCWQEHSLEEFRYSKKDFDKDLWETVEGYMKQLRNETEEMSRTTNPFAKTKYRVPRRPSLSEVIAAEEEANPNSF